MDKLLEEYNRYEEIIQKKKELQEELLKLSNTKEENSIKRINEISSSLGKLQEEENNYNKDNVEKISKYFSLQDKFNQVCKDIRAVESLSKKSQGEKVETYSSEGRKRRIEKTLLEDYKALVSEKNKLRHNIKKEYENTKTVKTLINNTIQKEETVEKKEIEYVLPKIISYDDLSTEDKIKETKKRLERIFNLSTLPNQGKKIIVTYENKKRPLARKYQGYYKETIKELGLLQSQKAKKEQPTISPIPIQNLKTNTNTTLEQSNKWFATIEDERIFNELFKDCPLPKQEKIYTMLFSKYAIARKTKLLEEINKRIEVEPTFKEQINLSKAKILTIGKNIKDKISLVGTKIKDKTTKIGESLKTQAVVIKEEVKEKQQISTTKAKELEYEVVNRTINLKANTCQKISEIKTKISSINKKDLLILQIKFNKLREKLESNKAKRKFSKNELFELVEILRKENEELKEKNKVLNEKIKILSQNSRSGYIATGIITIVGFLLVSTLIFTIVGKIVNH